LDYDMVRKMVGKERFSILENIIKIKKG